MPVLTAKARASLPDSAFAYIDSKGRRRLPINDEAHVRNALSRFNQTAFEDDAARDRARVRLLKAAKKYGIVPIGFMAGELRSAHSARKPKLPTGFVTLLLADLEDSTGLVQKLGERYVTFIDEIRALLRSAVQGSHGHEVDARADEMFAAFADPLGAVKAALKIHRDLASRKWPDDLECKVRIGLHSGRPTITEHGYVGVEVNTAARICAAAHGGQLLVSDATRAAVDGAGKRRGIGFRDVGMYRLRGLSGTHALYQVTARGVTEEFPPLRAEMIAET